MITTERADNFTEQLLSDETELRNATPNHKNLKTPPVTIERATCGGMKKNEFKI